MKYGKVRGGYYSIGNINNNQLYICEGFATGATIYKETRATVIVAFSGSNLLNVAKILRTRFPKKSIIITADNDHHSAKNSGLAYGIKAAESINAKLIYPNFYEFGNPKDCTDFNDYVNLGGIL